MWQKGYPLHVMHGYVIPAKEAQEFASLSTGSIHRRVANRSRRQRKTSPVALCCTCARPAYCDCAPKDIVFSALGVREGLLYTMLDAKERREDPLIAAASELNLCVRAPPCNGHELIEWADRFMADSD